jgi:hypothetical protein
MDLKWYIFGCNSLVVNKWEFVDEQPTEEAAISRLKDCFEYQYWKIEKIWSYPF